jgi:hypothetical protein
MTTLRGIFKTTPTAMQDNQQREIRLDNFGAVVVNTANADGTYAPGGGPTDPAYTQSGYLPAGTDRSGNTSATASTSTTLAAANATRRGLNIQNISANTIGINEVGGAAAIGSPGTYTIPAGGSVRINTNRAVTVVSGTATQPYTATEF